MREIDLIMSSINKKYKAQIIQEGTEISEVRKIPFSSPLANYMTYGGIPRCKITEFYGGEGGGKTTSALDICANAQKLFEKEYNDKLNELQAKINETNNKREITKLADSIEELEEKGKKLVAYIDTEQTLDIEWAQLLGVNTDELILVKPQEQTAEQVLQIILDIIKSDNIGLCVLDSIPCLVPQQIYEETLEKKAYGGVSQPLTTFSSKVLPLLVQHECALVCINQIREDLSSMYNTIKTVGGKAFKHACSLRLRFIKDSLLDNDNREISNRSENPAGNKVKIEITKTKVCKPDRRVGYYTLNYCRGIEVLFDAVNVAIFYNVIAKSGGWIKYLDKEGNIATDEEGNPMQFNGIPRFIEYLNNNPICKQQFLNTLFDISTKVN